MHTNNTKEIIEKAANIRRHTGMNWQDVSRSLIAAGHKLYRQDIDEFKFVSANLNRDVIKTHPDLRTHKIKTPVKKKKTRKKTNKSKKSYSLSSYSTGDLISELLKRGVSVSLSK